MAEALCLRTCLCWYKSWQQLPLPNFWRPGIFGGFTAASVPLGCEMHLGKALIVRGTMPASRQRWSACACLLPAAGQLLSRGGAAAVRKEDLVLAEEFLVPFEALLPAVEFK